jgi:hypothetical protein
VEVDDPTELAAAAREKPAEGGGAALVVATAPMPPGAANLVGAGTLVFAG